MQHRIHTGDIEMIDNMLKDDVIEEFTSPWSSPVVLVTEKDGATRFCADHRRLNEETWKDSYPLPRIDDRLNTLIVVQGHWI